MGIVCGGHTINSVVFSVAPPLDDGLPFMLDTGMGPAVNSLESRKGFVEIGRTDVFALVGLVEPTLVRKGLFEAKGESARSRGE